ncbi:hypothetical protein [Paraliobacillus sp. X-1268]|uniref:hypothetical protein n=1 Tax=Paraliobacillus sp. X-1268 TaxID=2213193 RepID=UPI000E3DCA71|nr:hypothetical protein [Paraliobacillus sp. X-1268]
MFEINFFNAERMATFWNYSKYLLEGVSLPIMIAFAITALGIFLPMIIKAFKKSDEEEQDFEYREF